MTRREQIRSAYRLTGGNAGFYDGMMTYSTLPGKAICRIVWNMDREKNIDYLERALSGVPEDFRTCASCRETWARCRSEMNSSTSCCR